MIRTPLAAAVVFLTCVGAACGGELEDRYHAGLRARGLFSVAEGAALRELRDADLTPSRRQAAAVRLALALAEHARFADGAERADLFARAADTLDDARRAFPAMPAVRLDATRGRVAATAARLAAHDALPDLAPSPADRDAAEGLLSIADARLSLIHGALGGRRRDLARGRSRDAEPLSAEELADLEDVAAIELAGVRLLRAESQPDGSEARGRLADAAKSLALPVRRETAATPANDPPGRRRPPRRESPRRLAEPHGGARGDRRDAAGAAGGRRAGRRRGVRGGGEKGGPRRRDGRPCWGTRPSIGPPSPSPGWPAKPAPPAGRTSPTTSWNG